MAAKIGDVAADQNHRPAMPAVPTVPAVARHGPGHAPAQIAPALRLAVQTSRPAGSIGRDCQNRLPAGVMAETAPKAAQHGVIKAPGGQGADACRQAGFHGAQARRFYEQDQPAPSHR